MVLAASLLWEKDKIAGIVSERAADVGNDGGLEATATPEYTAQPRLQHTRKLHNETIARTKLFQA
jgi:hypothetical protein